jgi:hypothetical protein
MNSLDKLIYRDDIWPFIGERIDEIQFALDDELRKSDKKGTQAWFYRIKDGKSGPKGITIRLFDEVREQMCLPETIRAICKVLPRIGQEFCRDSTPSLAFRDDTQFEKQIEGQNIMNPFVESMNIQYQAKSMLASSLLSQREDVQLKKHVTRLMLALGENDSWLKFAKAKGATSGAAAEKRISDAQSTGEPESIVIPLIAQAPGYLALTFLSELKTMIHSNNVSSVVETIEEHLMCVESAIQDKGDKIAQVNSSIRQWIIKHELCDITSQVDIQARVDALKDYEVTSLDDLKLLDKEDFEKCGFRGVKAKKAYNESK